MAACAHVRQGCVGIPAAVVSFGQQILRSNTLHAGTAGGKHAPTHHRFVERRCEQFLERESLDQCIRMRFEVIDGFAEAQSSNGSECSGGQ
jgi:hypothetical protein